jgi:hypothetical protein
MASSRAGSLDAGPKVATILVARRDMQGLLVTWFQFSHGNGYIPGSFGGRPEDGVPQASRNERQNIQNRIILLLGLILVSPIQTLSD